MYVEDDYYRRKAARPIHGMMAGVGFGLLFFVALAVIVAVVRWAWAI